MTKRVAVVVGTAFIVALVAAVLLPSLGKPSEAAQRLRCQANLRQIVQACRAYAQASGGAYPQRLSQALAVGNLDPSVAICPNEEVRAKGKVIAVASVDGRSDYRYFGAGLDQTATEKMLLLVEKEGRHPARANESTDGAHVVYIDGTIELIEADALSALLAQAAEARHRWEWEHRRAVYTPAAQGKP